MRIDGACHCGAVHDTAKIDPARVTVCHCTDCQRLAESPFRVSVLAEACAVAVIGGPPKTYVKQAENGRRRLQMFCGDCGSPLFTAADGTMPMSGE